MKSRQTLSLVLCVVMVCVFTLTVAYAALNTVLKIIGNVEVVASTWDIRLENPMVRQGSVNNNVPTIVSNKEASFNVILNTPGDYYEFTIDVVNNGSIDAMIESIEKTSTLSEEQAKFMNYIIEYENGNTISTKQLVEANSFVRLKVKVEFRKDLVSTDLPGSQNIFNLSFKLNYVQADEAGTTVVPNNGKLVKVVNGDGTNTSDEICIGEECFYVISSTDEEIIMLSKMNITLDNVPIQSSSAAFVSKGFSSIDYWSNIISSYPAYVYNENSYLYEYVENYKSYLDELGVFINEARLITIEELEGLGCSKSSDSCSGAPSWVYETSYWSGESYSSSYLWVVAANSDFSVGGYANSYFGVRPVIVISRSLI